MDTDELIEERWNEILGELPEGFSISVETGELKLLYRNRKERQLTPTEVCHHYVGNLAADSPDECDVKIFIQKAMGNFQREKIALKNPEKKAESRKDIKKKAPKKSKSPRK